MLFNFLLNKFCIFSVSKKKASFVVDCFIDCFFFFGRVLIFWQTARYSCRFFFNEFYKNYHFAQLRLYNFLYQACPALSSSSPLFRLTQLQAEIHLLEPKPLIAGEISKQMREKEEKNIFYHRRIFSLSFRENMNKCPVACVRVCVNDMLQIPSAHAV